MIQKHQTLRKFFIETDISDMTEFKLNNNRFLKEF
jgi:hypothetical protein